MAPLHRLDVCSVLETPDAYEIGEDDIIVDQQSGLPIANWSKLATVVNKVDVKYDFNVDGLVAYGSGREQVYTATTSVDRYAAQPSITAEFRGVRTSLPHTAELLARFSLIFHQYWGFPPPVLLCSVTFRRHLFETLDPIRVTHSLIPNYEGGRMGLDGERFVVLTVSPQFLDAQGNPNGRLDLALLWVGAIETSAVPLSSGALILALSAAESVFKDDTDVSIGLGSSVTLTTQAQCVRFRIGLKSLAYRTWQCFYDAYREIFPKSGPTCEFIGTCAPSAAFASQITYHIEYKTAAAPNIPGSGSDPTTGWVPLLGTSTRGIVGGAAGADAWTHYFQGGDVAPSASPNTYNVKIFFDSIATQGDPGGFDHPSCGIGGCADFLTSCSLIGDLQSFTADFIESVVTA